MKKSWLIVTLFAVLAFAYSAFETEATPTAPTLPQTVSRPIVETAAVASTPVSSTQVYLYPAGTPKAKPTRPGIKKKVQAHASTSSTTAEKASTRPGIQQEIPRAKPLNLLPRPGTDLDQKPVQINYELGENRHDVEERNTMRTRTHQEIKQYRLIAMHVSF